MADELLYAITALVAVLWLHRLYIQHKKKARTVEDDYTDILNKDEYRVKGKFES